MNTIKAKIRLTLLSVCIVFIGVIVFTNTINTSSDTVKALSKAEGKIKPKGFFKAFEYLQGLKVNQQTGIIDIGQQMNAMKGVLYLAKRKTGSIGFNWQELGPDNIGGRSRCILIDKFNTNLIYAGSVSGGLWKSETAGSSWVKIPEFNESYVVTCMVQDKDGNLYIGTGEGFYMREGAGTGGFPGRGVFFKAIGSSTFTQLPATLPSDFTSDGDWAYVNNLACDPITGRVYAATSKGLWFSDNKGQKWTNPLDLVKPFCQDVEVASDQTLVTVLESKPYICQTPYPSSGSMILTESSTGLPTNGIIRTEIAIAPSDPNYIYACIAKNNGTLEGVYVSINKGVSWKNLVYGSPFDPNNYDDNIFAPLGNQGSYDNEIVVAPDNKEKIFIGGLDMWTWSPGKTWTKISLWNNSESKNYIHADHHKYIFHPANPKIMYAATDGGIYRTIDGGTSFSAISKNFVTTQFYSLAYTLTGQVLGGTQDNGTQYINGKGNTIKSAWGIRGGDGGYCYASMINPSAFFASYTYGDILRSSDKGVTLQGESVNGTDHSKFYSSRLLDKYGELKFGAAFTSPFDMWESITDYATTDFLIYTAQKDQNIGDTMIIRSATGSYPFRYITNTAITKGEKIKVKDIVQSKFFLGVTDSVWMTRQALDFTKTPTWFNIAKISGTVQTMSHSKDGNYLFVGTNNGKLYRIKNLTSALDSISSDIKSGSCVVKTELINEYKNRAITSIAVDPQDANHIIVTLGNYGNTSYVFRSINALQDSVGFDTCQGNLPTMPVYSSLILNMHSDTVLIGTEYGVYSCSNISAKPVVWTSENSSPMDPIAVFMIRQQTMVIPGMTNLGVIYLASHGRGLFKSDLFIDTVTMSIKKPPLVIPQLKIYPNPVKDFLTISYVSDGRSQTDIKIYDLNGRIVLSSSFAKNTSGDVLKTIDCSELLTGTYFIRLTQGASKTSAKVIILH